MIVEVMTGIVVVMTGIVVVTSIAMGMEDGVDTPKVAQQVDAFVLFFSTPQGCKKGESCNLLHIPGERPELPPHTERRTNTCRDFFDKGCKYGDKCRFSHTRPAGGSTGAPPPPKEPTNGQENGEGEELEARRTRDYEPKPGEYSEEISVPAERVKLLLGNHAKKLHDINSSRGTNNSKIEKPESFHETITFKVYGAKEAVELAKKDIEKIVGITKARQEEARFQYMLKECERNARYMEMLAMANMRLRGTSEELSEDILKQISSCFKFEKRVNNVQQYVIEIDGYDKTRIDIVDTILGKMENNIQSVVFCSAEKVVKVVEKSQRKKPFGGANVVYLKPPGGSVDTTKAKIDRMAALEDFKNGTTIEVAQEGGPRNVVQRLLVATDDYARYSRKNEVPFVNLVIHYNFPKTHEAYLIRNNLLGRAGNQRGVSILLAAAQDLDEVKKLQSCTQIHSINLKELNDRLDVISKSLQDAVDTKERPLTKYSECEPRNSTWREELLKKEKATDAVERVDK
eukprot:PhF_6_TR43600/c0_g1_i1/m.66963